jgi:hypothetical protein
MRKNLKLINLDTQMCFHAHFEGLILERKIFIHYTCCSRLGLDFAP